MISSNGHVRPRLSVCIIARDNARTFDACLASIAPHVDEIIVVDTGSLDETPEIARRYGAKVVHFPWVDDFSAARNESLRHASGEWIFWMDTDDTIDEANGRKLRALADRASPFDVLGYIMQVHCPGSENGCDGVGTCVDHVKLIRNHPAIRFEHRIHEQILGAIRRLGGQVAWTDIFVVHSGAEHSPESKQRKYERDLCLLKLDLAEHPDHPFVLFNLGMTYDDMGAHAEAVDWLRKCLAVSHIEESHVRKVYALLVNSLCGLGEVREALAVCRQGIAHFDQDMELRFREGILLHRLGELLPAVEAYRRVLEVQESRHFTSVDPSIGGVKARHNLALVYEDLGKFDLAEMHWRLALEASPDFSPAYRALFGILLKQSKFVTCEQLIHNWSRMPQLQAATELLIAEFSVVKGDFAGALQEYETLLEQRSDDGEVLQSASQFYFVHREPVEAEGVLKRLIAIRPEDPAAHFNLAATYHRMNEIDLAKSAIKESLRLRPESQAACALKGQLEDR